VETLDSNQCSTVDIAESTVADQNGFDRANSNGNRRCTEAEHNRCDDHGADRAKKRREARDNDSPSEEHVEARQLFEAKCEEWGIAKEDRFRFGESLTRKQTAALTKTDHFSGWPVPSIKIYHYGLDGKRTDFLQLRFSIVSSKDVPIEGAPTFRYWHVAGVPTQPNFPNVPDTDWNAIAANTSIKVSCTEGSAKAWMLTKAGHPCIAISGVWAFESRRNGQFFLPELERIDWRGREVEVCYDSDIREKSGVLAACAALMGELLNRGAKSCSVLLPGPENGVDEYLKVHGVKKYEELERELFALTKPLYAFNERVALLRRPHAMIDLDTGEFSPVAEAKTWFKNKHVIVFGRDGKARSKPTIEAWLEWPLRKGFEGTNYLPGQPREVGRTWNSWPGWPTKAVKGDISLWDQLMIHIFGEDEEGRKARKYFEQWCAYPIKYPGVKLFAASVFLSRIQGSGKSLTFNVLGSVYGPNFGEIGPEQLKNPFNEYLIGKQFVLGDEITNRKNLRIEAEPLKRMVTRETVEINSKNLRQYTISDRVNWALTSNHLDAVFLDDKDRRFFIWTVRGGELPKGLRDRLVEWWKSGQSARALRWYFENEVDLTGFDPHAPALMTPAKESAIGAGMSDLETWAADLKADPMPLLRAGSENFKERDLWRLAELVAAVRLHLGVGNVSHKAMANALRKADISETERVYTPFGRVSLWVVKNPDRYRDMSVEDLATAYGAGLPKAVKF
jgi:hypothetical protein